MKGKFYKPMPSSSSQKTLAESSKPWKEKLNTPKIYIWKGSIPESLIKHQGEDAFQHISTTGRNKNTLDFLKSSQKYMNTIALPVELVPSRSSSLSHSHIDPNDLALPQALTEETRVNSHIDTIENHRSKLNKSKSEENFHDKVKDRDNIIFTLNHNNGKSLNSMKKFNLQLPKRDDDQYIITKFSLPKILIGPKKNENKQIIFNNRSIDKFINRFEKKKELFPVPNYRNGTNGWKLIEKKSKNK